MSDTQMMTDHLATVTPLRPASTDARPLTYRAHETAPPFIQPVARLAWRIEEQLGMLWDQQLSPYLLLEQFAPGKAEQARPLLDALFEAADEAAEVAIRISRGAWSPVFDAYDDAMSDLTQCLRGVR